MIEQAYLMWVGNEHYSGIDVYSDEAVTLGVSKRLPSAAAGIALSAPNTAIFVAHDEGDRHDCHECLGSLACPECRKRDQEAATLQATVDKMRDRFADFDAEATGHAKRSVRLNEDKIAALRAASRECELCAGERTYNGGTGGYVELNDGTRWDYREYMYWRNQPKKWDFRTELKEAHMCEACGGFGTLPECKVFGVFLPEKVEYILTGEETAEELEKLSAFALVGELALKAESERRCGRRKAGGVYATSAAGKPTKAARKLAKLLETKGKIKPGAEINGSYIKFPEPVVLAGHKRFRGIKRIPVDALLEDATEMVKEALEA